MRFARLTWMPSNSSSQGIMAAIFAPSPNRPFMPLLVALGVAHFLNDVIQSIIPAIYPLIKEAFHLDFARIGLISLAFQVTLSLLQPLLGYLNDTRPWPYAMVAGMISTLLGLLGLSFATSYEMVLVSAALVGLGSAVFHPEATRMARHAAAGRQGLAQGVCSVRRTCRLCHWPSACSRRCGAARTSEPGFLLRGGAHRHGADVLARCAAFSVPARAGCRPDQWRPQEPAGNRLPAGRIATSDGHPGRLAVSKNAYTASFSSYYTFYLIERFQVTLQVSQLMLCLYLAVGALGVIVGGVIGDRIGRDRVIWLSLFGSLPFRADAALCGFVLGPASSAS